MPAGLGWHPYFPKASAALRACVSLQWQNRADKIPHRQTDGAIVTALNSGVKVADLELDNAFNLSAGSTQIAWPQTSILLEMHASAALSHLVIYSPADEDFFCVEPVSHVPNSVNSTSPAQLTGARALAPGEWLNAELQLRVSDLPPAPDGAQLPRFPL